MAQEERPKVAEALQMIEQAKKSGNRAVLEKFKDDDRKMVQAALAEASIEIEEAAEDKKVLDDISQPAKKVSQDGWIEATLEEVKQYQAEGRLKGHDPLTGKCLLKS